MRPWPCPLGPPTTRRPVHSPTLPSPDGSLLPASEDTLMLFATFLSATLKPQSIKAYLYSVRNLHLEHGFPDPLPEARQLRRLLRGINRLKGSQPDARLPITPSLLRSFHKLLLMAHYDHLMLWAAGHQRYKPKTPCPALHSRPVT